jgi:hypothetical protein
MPNQWQKQNKKKKKKPKIPKVITSVFFCLSLLTPNINNWGPGFFVLTLYLIISPHSRFSLFNFTQFFEIKQHSKSFGSFLPFLQIKGAKKTTPVWVLFELVLLKHKLFKHWFPTGETMFLAAGQGFYEKIYFLPKFLILVDAPKGLCTRGSFLLLFKKFFFV